MATQQKKRVAVIGAGAAGMSCATALAKHPDKFTVTLIDSVGQTGGQATSLDLDPKQHGASWLNDGVQGGSGIFKHTFRFFSRYGFSPHEVKLQVSFGKGPDAFFTNVFPSPLVDSFAAEIRKLGRVLKVIKYFLPVLGIVPVKVILKLFRFSTEFGNRMLLPLLALFLGTGNQTPNISAALLERLMDDPQMGLWTYDPDELLTNLPTMYTFPRLSEFYHAWSTDLEQGKGVRLLLSTTVDIVSRKSGPGGIVLMFHAREGERTESFDELVLATPADESLKLLGRHATWRERYVLGGVKFYDDVTITHSDAAYFNSIFETRFRDELCSDRITSASAKRQDQLSFATTSPPVCETNGWRGFAPMYFTHSYESEQDKIEMGFDCSNYQHQFREAVGEGNAPLAPERHVYQTIFLDKERSDLWTKDAIDKNKVIGEKWWHQFGHRWQHYLRVVPGMMFVNGENSTVFAGAWTLVNMHEIACISGIAAAYRLGATYEEFDDFATGLFSKYLLLSHGVRYKPQDKKRT
jgi:predicted NAD/FAD-binding protein